MWLKRYYTVSELRGFRNVRDISIILYYITYYNTYAFVSAVLPVSSYPGKIRKQHLARAKDLGEVGEGWPKHADFPRLSAQ